MILMSECSKIFSIEAHCFVNFPSDLLNTQDLPVLDYLGTVCVSIFSGHFREEFTGGSYNGSSPKNHPVFYILLRWLSIYETKLTYGSSIYETSIERDNGGELEETHSWVGYA